MQGPNGRGLNLSPMIDRTRYAADQGAGAPDLIGELHVKVAEQFEAIFLNEFLKQARKAKLAEDLFASSAEETYEDMLDREMSTHLSSQVNSGIAEALVRQLGGKEVS